jgi:hypothetical protein
MWMCLLFPLEEYKLKVFVNIYLRGYLAEDNRKFARSKPRWEIGALVFKLSVWCGVEGCVSGFRPARKPDKQPSVPHHTDNLKTKAPNTTGGNQLYNTFELLMMGIWCPKHVAQAIRSAIKNICCI